MREDFFKKDLETKLTQEQKNKIDAAVSALKDALAGTDTDKIKTKADELTKTLQEVGTIIYQQAAEQAKQQEQKSETGAPPTEEPKPDGEKVVDSEDYKVK
jgi:molecular chaperone DnaK